MENWKEETLTKMPDILIQELEKCSNLINQNKFVEVNRYLKSVFGILNFGRIYDFFCACDIDPLKYVSEIDEAFISGTWQEEIYIPKHIKWIAESNFDYFDHVKKLTIPKDLEFCLSLKILGREAEGKIEIVRY